MIAPGKTAPVSCWKSYSMFHRRCSATRKKIVLIEECDKNEIRTRFFQLMLSFRAVWTIKDISRVRYSGKRSRNSLIILGWTTDWRGTESSLWSSSSSSSASFFAPFFFSAFLFDLESIARPSTISSLQSTNTYWAGRRNRRKPPSYIVRIVSSTPANRSSRLPTCKHNLIYASKQKRSMLISHGENDLRQTLTPSIMYRSWVEFDCLEITRHCCKHQARSCKQTNLLAKSNIERVPNTRPSLANPIGRSKRTDVFIVRCVLLAKREREKGWRSPFDWINDQEWNRCVQALVCKP